MDINIFLIFKIYLSFKIIFEAGITIDFSIKKIDASNMIQLKNTYLVHSLWALLGCFQACITSLYEPLHNIPDYTPVLQA